MTEYEEEQKFKHHVIHHMEYKFPGTCPWCRKEVDKRK